MGALRPRWGAQAVCGRPHPSHIPLQDGAAFGFSAFRLDGQAGLDKLTWRRMAVPISGHNILPFPPFPFLLLGSFCRGEGKAPKFLNWKHFRDGL